MQVHFAVDFTFIRCWITCISAKIWSDHFYMIPVNLLLASKSNILSIRNKPISVYFCHVFVSYKIWFAGYGSHFAGRYQQQTRKSEEILQNVMCVIPLLRACTCVQLLVTFLRYLQLQHYWKHCVSIRNRATCAEMLC